MTVSTFVDSFTVNAADVAGTTYVRTGYGAAPKALLCWAIGRAEAVDTVGQGNIRYSVGFASAATQRGCVGGFSEDNLAASSVSNRVRQSDAVIVELSNIDTVTGLLDVSTFDADGITFIVDDQFVANTRVMVWAIGGTSITNAFVNSASMMAATGNESRTDVGFQPDVTFFMSTSSGASSGNVSAEWRLGVGYAVSSTKQGVIGTKTQDAVVAVTNTARYSIDAECIAGQGAGASHNPIRRAEFVSNDVGGFTINTLETIGAQVIIYMCIKGGRWNTGNFITRNDTNDIVVTGLVGKPVGLLAMTHGTGESVQDTAQDSLFWSIGAASSTANRGSMGCHDADAAAVSQTSTIVEHDELLALVDTDAIGFLVDLKSFDTNGFTVVMDDNDDGRNAFCHWVSVESSDKPQHLLTLGVGR